MSTSALIEVCQQAILEEWVPFMEATSQDLLAHQALLVRKRQESQAKEDEFAKLLNRLLPAMADDPTMTVSEALKALSPAPAA